jgi:excinuclease ABC subunit A
MTVLAVRGARVHNLRGVDVDIPRDALVVITGVSGSGKSSLAFDTIYAEGQRRYVESLSAYARQFLEQMGKPDVDSIDGLSPAIAIEQRASSRNPRSTVGTVTELQDYLRLLYARAGDVYCYNCGERIEAQTVQTMVDAALALPERARFSVIAPVVRGAKGAHKKLLEQLRREGYIRAGIDGELWDLSQHMPSLDKARVHDIDVYVDRLVRKDGIRQRLSDSIELAVGLADGMVRIQPVEGEGQTFSERFACIDCGISYPPIEPRMFSFNNPHGACPDCDGLGLDIPAGERDRADAPPSDDEGGDPFEQRATCKSCNGTRLRTEARFVRIGGESLPDVTSMPLDEAHRFFTGVSLSPRQQAIGGRVLREIGDRLGFLVSVGLGYLTLDRGAATLSGGEAQRIRLATQIGSSLMGVLYILDEPSMGLHPRDTDRLLDALRRLRGLGNTVLVVEHDEATIRAADYVVDMGPRAGVHGGRVVAAGTPDEIAAHPDSLTGAYLSGAQSIAVPGSRRRARKTIDVRGARQHNLRGVDASFPVGVLTCVTGVSGSGKSTLVIDTLMRALQQRLGNQAGAVGAHDALEGAHHVDRVISIDQSPIGRTPRSNPATYTGLFTQLRDLFAQLPESKVRGYKAGRYSFNVKGGRCESCQGDGILRIEMHFLPDVFVTCDVCSGKRYNRETLEVRYKGLNIAEMLELTVAEALDVLAHVPKIRHRLQTLRDVGLGYLKLGQSATTLSGGEAQRLKLSRELAKQAGGRALYVLDEPTTGLHFDDINRLLHVLQLLVDDGNTIVVIEHNLDVIKTADHVIDLGPEGGTAGGRIVAAGTPEQVAAVDGSHTGNWLRDVLRPKTGP